MATTVEELTAKTELLEVEPKVQMEKEENAEAEPKVQAEKEEDVEVEVEPKGGVSFPIKLDDGKQLNSVGLRKKTILGIGIKVYSFGIYADNEKMKELLESKIGKAPEKPTEEMYQLVIDSDVGMTVRLVIVFGGITMSMVKKNFEEGLGQSIKKLNGGQRNDELSNMVLSAASNKIKLNAGSVIEITKLPGFSLQTKVKGEVLSTVESELLCRAYVNLYLGDDPFDIEAKDRFGASVLSLFKHK